MKEQPRLLYSTLRSVQKPGWFSSREKALPKALKGGDMLTSASKKNERRDSNRRIADRALNDLYKTFSTPQCHSCLERTANAVLLLDSERRVMYVTSQADQIMSQSKIAFTLRPRFTLPPSPNAVHFTTFAKRGNTDPGPLILMLTDDKKQDKLLLTCFRLPKPATTNLYVARYLVTLRDPNHFPSRQWQFFTEQFNLTNAEARLCHALANGLTLNDYCTNWHVTLNTARSQLKSIFAKTSTHGQSDLLRLIYLFSQT